MNYEEFMMQLEELQALDEVTARGITNAVARRAFRRGGQEVKSKIDSQARGGTTAGQAANKVSSTATNVADAKQGAKAVKATGRYAAKKAAQAAPKTAASAAKVLKPLKGLVGKAGTALKTASKPLAAAGKAVAKYSPPLMAASVGKDKDGTG